LGISTLIQLRFWEQSWRVMSMLKWVDSLGIIKDNTGKIFADCLNSHGYANVILRKNGKAYSKKVHRLVCQAFLDNPLNLRCVNHKNGIKSDNRLINLEWVSHRQNTQHAVLNGLTKMPFGENSRRAILTDNDVIHIRSVGKTVTLQSLADKYGVKVSTIHNARKGKSFSHLNNQYDVVI